MNFVWWHPSMYDHPVELSSLALAAPAGANGVTLLPYYGGERTPNRPSATGTWVGLSGRARVIVRGESEADLLARDAGLD